MATEWCFFGTAVVRKHRNCWQCGQYTQCTRCEKRWLCHEHWVQLGQTVWSHKVFCRCAVCQTAQVYPPLVVLPDEINTHPQQPACAHLIRGQLQIGDIQYEWTGSASSSVMVAPAVAAAVPRPSPVERSTPDCLDTGFVVLPPNLQLENLPDENEYTLIGDPCRGETVTYHHC